MSMTTERDFNFITDRLAIGNLASRATPGFVAVVSVVTVEGRHRGRPWSAELTKKAPQVPGGVPMDGLAEALNINEFTSRGSTPVWIVDIADGEAMPPASSPSTFVEAVSSFTAVLDEIDRQPLLLRTCADMRA